MNASWQIGPRLVIGISLALLLSSCAMPADPSRMNASATAVGGDFPAALHQAMCVRAVTGGEETNPLWASKLSNQDFTIALSTSMNSAGLAAPSGSCKYPVDVNLLGLSQPSAGFAMEVTLHANYKVYDGAGQPVMLETITAPYTAAFSEAFAGYVRLQRANEGAVRTSIAMFFDKLRAVKPS
jgi:hypothetical protein